LSRGSVLHRPAGIGQHPRQRAREFAVAGLAGAGDASDRNPLDRPLDVCLGRRRLLGWRGIGGLRPAGAVKGLVIDLLLGTGAGLGQVVERRRARRRNGRFREGLGGVRAPGEQPCEKQEHDGCRPRRH
jgi:hypothetical protein